MVTTLKNTQEVKKTEQKINELNIPLPDSSTTSQIVNTFNQLKGLSNDTTRKELVDTLKRAKEEAKERATNQLSEPKFLRLLKLLEIIILIILYIL